MLTMFKGGLCMLMLSALSVNAQSTLLSDLLQGAPNQSDPYALLFIGIRENSNHATGKKANTGEWQKGLLVDLEDQLYEVDMRFFPEKGKLFVLLDGTSYQVYPDKIRGLRIEGQTYVPAYYYSRSGEKLVGFFALLSEGQVNLLRQVESGAFSLGDQFYLQEPNETAVPVKGGTRKLLEQLPEQRLQLEEFLEANKLNLKKEKDLIRLIDYCNSLP